MSEIMQSLFETGAHLGYRKSRRHPSVQDHILVTKNTRDMIDLEKTEQALNTALEALKEIKQAGKMILFVGSKPEARDITIGIAGSLNMPYVDERWIGGTLTNFSEIRKRVERLADLQYKQEKNELIFKTKKEKLLIEREIARLTKNFGGLLFMNKLPDALFIIDSRTESIAVIEAQRKNIPVFALANTDCDITTINYPIVCNDASRATITRITEYVRKELSA